MEPDGSSGVKAGEQTQVGQDQGAEDPSGRQKSCGPRSSWRSRSAASGRKHSVVDRLAGLTNRWSNRTIGMAMIESSPRSRRALTLSAPLRS